MQGNAVHPYLRRRAGEEEVTYAHDSLRPILEDTLGVILYQEQVMQVAIEVCGYTAVEADIFRKAMGSHRSHAKMQAERPRFIGGAMRTGLTEQQAEELFEKCSAFAEFGFARAHAAAFAKISYDTAWLKRYWPAHYTVGVLNNQPMGFYSPAVVINDAKRHGIRVLPIDVNASAWEHDTRPLPGDEPHPHAIRLGLRQVKGIDQNDREVLEAERARGPYTSVRDFVARTGLGEQVVERLISIGAFDWTDAPRRELLWQLRTTLSDADPAHHHWAARTSPGPRVSNRRRTAGPSRVVRARRGRAQMFRDLLCDDRKNDLRAVIARRRNLRAAHLQASRPARECPLHDRQAPLPARDCPMRTRRCRGVSHPSVSD